MKQSFHLPKDIWIHHVLPEILVFETHYNFGSCCKYFRNMSLMFYNHWINISSTSPVQEQFIIKQITLIDNEIRRYGEEQEIKTKLLKSKCRNLHKYNICDFILENKISVIWKKCHGMIEILQRYLEKFMGFLEIGIPYYDIRCTGYENFITLMTHGMKEYH